MGELYRKARERKDIPVDMVQVSMRMPTAAWAVLKIWADMSEASNGLGEQARNALTKAKVVEEEPCVLCWQVEGPPGVGPWFESAQAAAEFIAEESTEDGHEPVIFADAELRSLGRFGAMVEKDHWSIECVAVPVSDLDREWLGW